MESDIVGSPWSLELDEIRARGVYRQMPRVSGLPGRVVTVNGVRALNFSGNNYLGLAGDAALIKAAVEYTERYGAGSTASRLICGDTEAHRELEDFIARWKQTEAALVFGSGYQANVGIISSLVNRADLIVSDELNHASIIDGCRLSGARVEVYPHADVSRLEDLLRLGGFRRKLVVTESVFSMDGDSAPIREIAMLCRKAGAMLMVDEAHASGVLGPQGRGLAAAEGVCPDIQMGTMGKAVGASGAYVAGPRPLIELLVNRARPLIYTTAQPPGVIGAALAGLKIISSEEGDRRRSRLAENGRLFPRLLTKAFGSSHRPGHIVPFLIGESARTMRISALCLAKGVFAHGIRRPTVPEGSARLRFTLMSDHTEEDIRRCALAVKQAVEQDRETAP